MSSAKITIWDTTVGYITWDDDQNTAIFESDEAYLSSPVNIAPILHSDKRKLLNGYDFPKQFNGMIPTFNDSLPDSFGNIVFKEWLEQKNVDQAQMNPVERLLYVGKRGIGALEYHKAKDLPEMAHNLDLEEMAEISDKIIKRKYDETDYAHHPEALHNILTIGSSVGGAQAKILVAITQEKRKENEKWLPGDIVHHVPVDYYIVKLEHDPQNLWHKEKNYIEYVYNQIANDIGIHVAESRLIHEGGRAHFASIRFDRVDNRKIHQQTVNALTGFYGRNTEFGYEDIFRMMEYLNLPYGDKEQLFRQMVFNVAASNRDDHTKNFSFLMDEGGQWSLSPAYDLTFPVDPYQSFSVPHKISINKKVQKIERADLAAVAKKVGIRRFDEIIDRVIDGVSTFPQRVKDFDLTPKTVALIKADIEKNIARIV